MSHKLTTDHFKEKFFKYYGNDFDLAETNYINSDIHLTIRCLKHGNFKKIPWSLFKNNINPCPQCKKQFSKEYLVTDTQSFIRKANIVHNNKYDYSKTQYTGNSQKLEIICKIHGVFSTTADQHVNSANGCKKCTVEKHRMKKDDILLKFKEIHKDKNYQYPDFENNNTFDYKSSKQKTAIICPKHGVFNQTIDIHLFGGSICPSCANENQRLTIDEIINRSNKIHNNKYDYSLLLNYDGHNNEKMSIICPKHGVFKQIISNHIRGGGCPKCGTDKIRLTLQEFIENSRKVHGNKYDYSLIKEYPGKNSCRVLIICSNHGEFKQSINTHLVGSGCPRCKSSQGENKIMRVLEQINIKYNHRFRVEIKNNYYWFDFYLPDHNIMIEFNGGQHYKPVKIWGGEKSLKQIKKRDKIKIQYCKENNIKLIIIPYWKSKHINEILSKEVLLLQDSLISQ